MKKKIATIIIIVLCAALILVGFYFVLQKGNAEADVDISEVEYLTCMDLENNYPTTPRAVTNLYCRMLACMYDEECSEDELDALFNRMYLLYDSELQAANPLSEYKLAMTADLLAKQKNGYKISDYILPDTDEVTKKKVDGEDMVLLTVAFYSKNEAGFTKTYQDFMLRKDNGGYWKIYGYSLHR